MRALTQFERYLESLLEGGFLRLFRSRLQPADLAKRLLRAMEQQQTLVGGRTLVPNEYAIGLSQADYDAFEPIRRTLERELAALLAGSAAERGWGVSTPPVVRLERAAALPVGQVALTARLVDQPEPRGDAADADPPRALPRAGPAESPTLPAGDVVLWLEADGAQWRVRLPVAASVTLGRELDNDVVLAHPSVSRHHARLVRQADNLTIEDLGSANGTWRNGQRVSSAPLGPGDDLGLGGLALRVRVGRDDAAGAPWPDAPAGEQS
jgi:hypothetical protein